MQWLHFHGLRARMKSLEKFAEVCDYSYLAEALNYILKQLKTLITENRHLQENKMDPEAWYHIEGSMMSEIELMNKMGIPDPETGKHRKYIRPEKAAYSDICNYLITSHLEIWKKWLEFSETLDEARKATHIDPFHGYGEIIMEILFKNYNREYERQNITYNDEGQPEYRQI